MDVSFLWLGLGFEEAGLTAGEAKKHAGGMFFRPGGESMSR